jgi:hypothetical protein
MYTDKSTSQLRAKSAPTRTAHSYEANQVATPALSKAYFNPEHQATSGMASNASFAHAGLHFLDGYDKVESELKVSKVAHVALKTGMT